MSENCVGKTEEDRALVRKKSLEEPGKVDCATEHKDEWVTLLYWFRLEIEEEVWQDVIMQTQFTDSWWRVWWEDKKRGSASTREEIWPKSFPFITTFLLFCLFRNNSHKNCEENRKKEVFFLSRLEINLFITVFEMENEQRHVLARADRTTTAKKYFPLWKNKNIKLLWSGFCITNWQRELSSMKREKNIRHATKAMNGVFYLPLSKQDDLIRKVCFLHENVRCFF